MDQTASPITVFIVEDHAGVRERLVALLGRAGGYRVVGEADNPGDAIDGILRTRPDSVVLDIHLVGGTGLEVIKAVHPREPGIRFVVVTSYDNPQYRKAFAAAGASRLLDKSTEIGLLPEVLRECLATRP